MDYSELAKELLHKMQLLHKAKQHKSINEGIHGEAFILYYIKNNREGVVPGDISSAMGISSARIAAALNSLEKKGFITREIDVSDRRRIIVDLTPEGKAHEEEQEKFFMNMITNMLMQLGEQDAKDYVRITGRLAEAFSKNKA